MPDKALQVGDADKQAEKRIEYIRVVKKGLSAASKADPAGKS